MNDPTPATGPEPVPPADEAAERRHDEDLERALDEALAGDPPPLGEEGRARIRQRLAPELAARRVPRLRDGLLLAAGMLLSVGLIAGAAVFRTMGEGNPSIALNGGAELQVQAPRSAARFPTGGTRPMWLGYGVPGRGSGSDGDETGSDWRVEGGEGGESGGDGGESGNDEDGDDGDKMVDQLARLERTIRGASGGQQPRELMDSSVGYGGGTGGARGEGRKPSAGLPKHWKPSPLPGGAVQLSVGDKETLPLVGYQLSARVDGHRARVVIEATFENTHDRRLEGTFRLRLPDSASPCFLAFGPVGQVSARSLLAQGARRLPRELLSLGTGSEVPLSLAERSASEHSGGIKVAVMVERARAQRAYRQTVRQRAVDPALLEWSGAGVFSTRVFPLFEKRRSQVVLAYDVDLRPLGAEQGLDLQLPAVAEGGARSLELDASRPAARTSSPVSWRRSGGRARLALGSNAPEALELRWPLDDRAIVSQDARLDALFAARVRVPELAGEETAGRPRGVFLLDCSRSAHAQFDAQLRLLDAVLTENEGELREFAVLCFDVARRWWRPRWSANDAASRKALQAELAQLTLEGATDLAGALGAVGAAEWTAGADLFLLSDGRASWGQRAPRALRQALGERRLFAYALGAGGATGTLAELAGRSGGGLFVASDPRELKPLARAHRKPRWQLVAARCLGGSDVRLAGAPAQVYSGMALQLVGRGTPTAVELDVVSDSVRRTLRVPLEHTITSPLAARAYGQLAVQQLEAAGCPRPLTAAYARYFRVPGKSCSLLMLESKADYQRHGIRDREAEDSARIRRRGINRSLDEQPELPLDARSLLLRRIAALEQIGAKLSTPLLSMLASAEPGQLSLALEELSGQLRRNELPDGTNKRLAAARFRGEPLFREVRRRVAAKQLDAALRLASTLVEETPGDAVALRAAAFAALRCGRPGQAADLLWRVIAARPNQAGPALTLLARCYTQRARPLLAAVALQLAHSRGDWGQFRGLSVVTRDLTQRLHRSLKPGPLRDLLAQPRPKTTPLSSATVRIWWTLPETDVDLHLQQPDGATCNHKTPRTPAGSHLSGDTTQGLGPELITVASRPGTYLASLHYYASDRLRTSAATWVLAEIEQHGQRSYHLVQLVSKQEQRVVVGEVVVR